MMKRFPMALMAGLSLAVLACDDGAGPGDGACEAVTPLSVDAAGSPPNFAWTPACGVARVEVIRLDNDAGGPDTDETVWRVESGSNSIDPTIAYGVVPAGASEIVPDVTLVSGEQYRVAIYVFDTPTGDYFLQASATFTRP
ncbi:MAG TPA: hypothetical protein VFS94_11985 [Gemmatimonadales bacterium]|nr:hypothetical protein [Gemmatimonadales bacterium]